MTLSSLAARIMARGEYPYRVRAVPPPEPYEPEPYPDEPFAPLYGFAPYAPGSYGLADRLPDPHGPDRIVFGSGQQTTPGYGDLLLRCARCDVKWAYGAGVACWYCGRPG